MSVNPQASSKVCPKSGDKLRTLIGGYVRRNAKSANPAGEEGGSAGSCQDIFEQEDLWPVRQPVDDCEEMCASSRRRQWSN